MGGFCWWIEEAHGGSLSKGTALSSLINNNSHLNGALGDARPADVLVKIYISILYV